MCSIQFAAIKVTEANAQKLYFKADPWRGRGIACVFSCYNFKRMRRKTCHLWEKGAYELTQQTVERKGTVWSRRPVGAIESQPGAQGNTLCAAFPDF